MMFGMLLLLQALQQGCPCGALRTIGLIIISSARHAAKGFVVVWLFPFD
jgi:hypothetical protein